MMSEHKFILDTKKSLHKPIIVILNGKEYVIEKINKSLFDKITKHEKKAVKGNIDALYKQVATILDVNVNEIVDADIRDIQALINFIVEKIYNPELSEDTKEKKV